MIRTHLIIWPSDEPVRGGEITSGSTIEFELESGKVVGIEEENMVKRNIGIEHLPLVSKLIDTLETEHNPVNQQIAIELLMMRHALRTGDLRSAQFVLDGMHKHATQLIMSPPVDLGDL